MLGENYACEPRDFLRNQRDARARFVAAPLKLGARARPRLLHAGTIESRCKQLLLQLEPEQPPQPSAMRFARLLCGIEDLETDGIFVVRQTRIADERLRASPDVHDLLEIAEIPGGDFRRRRIRVLVRPKEGVDELRQRAQRVAELLRK